jgi:hypothetical protein
LRSSHTSKPLAKPAARESVPPPVKATVRKPCCESHAARVVARSRFASASLAARDWKSAWCEAVVALAGATAFSNTNALFAQRSSSGDVARG